MHRQLERTPGQVPQGLFHQRQRPISELPGTAALPVRQVLPDALAIHWVATDQHFAHEGFDDVRTNQLGRAESIALGAIVATDSQQSHLDHDLIAWMGMTGAVLGTARRGGKNFDVNACDSHGEEHQCCYCLFVCRHTT
ncbi:hypothetical protein D3C78_1332530 [compost metagenome]